VRNHGTTSTTTEKRRRRDGVKDTQGRRKSLGGFFFLFPAKEERKKSVPTKSRALWNSATFFFAGWPRNKSHPHTLDPLLIFPQQ
jgi:hypothetical protein